MVYVVSHWVMHGLIYLNVSREHQQEAQRRLLEQKILRTTACPDIVTGR